MVGKYVHNSNVDANKSWIKSRERFQIARQTSFYDAARIFLATHIFPTIAINDRFRETNVGPKERSVFERNGLAVPPYKAS